MNLELSVEQQQLAEAFATFFSKESPPSRVRDSEPTGFDPVLWRSFLGMGGLDMGLPEAHQGGGASILDLSLVAEEQGKQLAPIPFVESVVALRLLVTASTDAELVKSTLNRAISGDTIVTLAPRSVRGPVTQLVPGGAIADHVIAFADQVLLLTDQAPGSVRPNLGAMPLADVALSAGGTQLAQDSEATQHFSRAVDEWKVLTASMLLGLATQALDIGVDYVKQREAFGVPIGAFQAVAHRLADVATAIDGARLLIRKAAWSCEHDPGSAPKIASMAWILAGEVAKESSAASLHFHGGYGFMLEYDIQLYYRRARAWALVYGDPRKEHQRLADRLFGTTEGTDGL